MNYVLKILPSTTIMHWQHFYRYTPSNSNKLSAIEMPSKIFSLTKKKRSTSGRQSVV